MIEWVNVLMPYAATIFGTVFLERKIFNKGIRGLKDIKEYQDLFDKYETSFKENFIKEDLEESYFMARTGINANLVDIEKYYAFKKALGSGYNWQAIKEVRLFLNLNGDTISVNLKDWQVALGITLLCAGIVSISFGFWILYYYATYLYAGKVNEFVEFASISVVCVIAGFFLLIQSSPIFLAKGMKKRLQ